MLEDKLLDVQIFLNYNYLKILAMAIEFILNFII